MRACFCLETRLNKFYHISAQMGISCVKCVLEKIEKQILKTHSLLNFLDTLSIYRRLN